MAQAICMVIDGSDIYLGGYYHEDNGNEDSTTIFPCYWINQTQYDLFDEVIYTGWVYGIFMM